MPIGVKFYFTHKVLWACTNYKDRCEVYVLNFKYVRMAFVWVVVVV